MVHSILPLLNEHIWLRHAGIINWPFHLIYQYQIKIKFKKRNAQKGKLTGLGTGATQPPQLQARWMAQQQQPCLPCHTHHRVLHRKTHKNLKGNQTEAVSQEGPITKNAIQNNRHTDMPVLLLLFFLSISCPVCQNSTFESHKATTLMLPFCAQWFVLMTIWTRLASFFCSSLLKN